MQKYMNQGLILALLLGYLSLMSCSSNQNPTGSNVAPADASISTVRNIPMPGKKCMTDPNTGMETCTFTICNPPSAAGGTPTCTEYSNVPVNPAGGTPVPVVSMSPYPYPSTSPSP